MDQPATPAITPLPAQPYPGLRPFQPHESALLFGREKQVREVIDRLRQTQFVAIIGGSGSGKSSLVHAGVVPELRSFGIPGAGDFWIPMACTPGTNVSDADRASARHTPITRLARQFAALLRSRGSADDDAARLDEIAAVFRQEAGFARLLDAYGAELQVPRGPDPRDARLLFVVDQFEELFHPTNTDVEDGRLLVERVIDHFFNPHPRCYVVLTMRSEHLNDCAGYLELPDAINKSSYLVRRLDGDELRDAIVGPAQRYLRLQARQAQAADRLPPAVDFDPSMLARVLADVQAITADSDHLPLLQHLLARLWQAAMLRCGPGTVVPAEITVADLASAVAAPVGEANVLRASLENWAEVLYGRLAPAQRPAFDALLRQLAYKDPNTGMYTQQRIEVDAAPGGRDAVRALVQGGFIGGADFMLWDDDDPARVTLKVSHESFIRGWLRFRRLIDGDADRFDEFMAVLRKCAVWSAGQRSPELLLEAGELRRLADAQVAQTLASTPERQAWFRFLQLERDGARLAQTEPLVDDFIARSKAAQRKLRRNRLRNLGLAVGMPALVLLVMMLYSVLIVQPVTQRAQTLFAAGSVANQSALGDSTPAVGGAAETLDSLLRAAELFDAGRQGNEGGMARLSGVLTGTLGWLPPVARQQQFLLGVASQAEPPVNERLRRLLSGALWLGEAPAGAPPIEAATSREETCFVSSETTLPAPVRGRLFLWGQGPDEKSRRGVFVPAVTEGKDEFVSLRGATWDGRRNSCASTQLIMQVALNSEPRLLLDADLRHLLLSASGAYVDQPVVTLYELDWERAEDGQSWTIAATSAARVIDPKAVAAVHAAAGPDGMAAVDTWLRPAGRTLAVAGAPWRIVSPSAQPLPRPPADAALVPLQPAAEASACALLQQQLARHLRPGFRGEMWSDGGRCFAVQRGNPAGAGDAREEVRVAVYPEPDAAAARRQLRSPPAPMAQLPLFYRADKGLGRWQAGKSGDLRGWLVLQGAERAAPQDAVGAPWSTCALWRLGSSLAAQNPLPADAAPPAGDMRITREGCDSE